MDVPMRKLDSTYGAAFAGLIISAIMYGVTNLQTFLYFRTYYHQDSRKLKILVFSIWLLDTVHVALSTAAMYWYLVSNYFHPDALFKEHWTLSAQTDVNGVIGFVVQCFFARRVWKLSKNIFLTVLIVLLSFIYITMGIVFTVKTALLSSISESNKLIWVTATGIGSAAAADVLIAGAMCYYLSRNRSGFRRTDDLVTALIVYSLTTGLMTSIVAVIVAITFTVMPTNYIWLAFFFILGKCYVNSLLSALNSRVALKELAYRSGDNAMFQMSNYNSPLHSPTSPTIPAFVNRFSQLPPPRKHVSVSPPELTRSLPQLETSKYPALVVHVERRVSCD